MQSQTLQAAAYLTRNAHPKRSPCSCAFIGLQHPDQNFHDAHAANLAYSSWFHLSIQSVPEIGLGGLSFEGSAGFIKPFFSELSMLSDFPFPADPSAQPFF